MNRHVARLCLPLLLSALCCAPALAAKLTGEVVRVIDGDSVVFQPAGAGEALEVRLKGIDAPEGCQAGGEAARDYLRDTVSGKTLELHTRGKDHYGRTLGVLRLDGTDLNERLVAEGHAWSLGRRSDRSSYAAKERVAIVLKRGVHAERGAVHPGEFRRKHGPCKGPGSSDAASQSTAPPEAPVAAPFTPATAVAAGFRCDGRTHCSQMKSCAEATYFLQNCPGVKMDGNNDGVPCERQWCSSPR